MKTKLSQAKERADAGDWVGCLRIVARFPELGDEGAVITRGWNAHLRPQFYTEMGYDPVALFEQAVAAVCARYGWVIAK